MISRRVLAAAAALCGVALAFFHVWLLVIGVVVLLLALIPAVAMLPALVSLAILAAVLSALIGYETFRYAEERRQVRGAAHEH